MKKGGKRVLSLGGKSSKNRKKSKRRSKRGGEVTDVDDLDALSKNNIVEVVYGDGRTAFMRNDLLRSNNLLNPYLELTKGDGMPVKVSFGASKSLIL